MSLSDLKSFRLTLSPVRILHLGVVRSRILSYLYDTKTIQSYHGSWTSNLVLTFSRGKKTRENVVLVVGEPPLTSLQTILQSELLQSPSSLLIIASHRPPAAPLLVPRQSERNSGASRCKIRILHLAQPITSPITGSARVVEVLEWAERTARVWRHGRISSSTPSSPYSPSSPTTTPSPHPSRRPRAKLRSRLSTNLSNFTTPSNAESEDDNGVPNMDVQVQYELADPLSPKRVRAQSAFLHGGSTSDFQSSATSPISPISPSPQTPSPTSPGPTPQSSKSSSTKSKNGNSLSVGSALPPWDPTRRAFDVVLHFISSSSDGGAIATDMDYKMSLRNSILVSTALRPYLVAATSTTASGILKSSPVQKSFSGQIESVMTKSDGEAIKTTSVNRVGESVSRSGLKVQTAAQSKKWLFFRTTSTPSSPTGQNISPQHPSSAAQSSTLTNGSSPESLDITADLSTLESLNSLNAARLIHVLPSRFSPASANSATIPKSKSNLNMLFIRSLESFLMTFCAQPYGLGPAPRAPGVSPFTSTTPSSTGKKSGGNVFKKGLGLKSKGLLGRSESAPVLSNSGNAEIKEKIGEKDHNGFSAQQQIRVRPYVLTTSSLGDVLRIASNVSPVDNQQRLSVTTKSAGYTLTLLDLIISGSLDPSPLSTPSNNNSRITSLASTPASTLSQRAKEKQREYEKERGAKFDLWDDGSEGDGRGGLGFGTRAWIGGVADLVVRTKAPQMKRLMGPQNADEGNVPGSLPSAVQNVKNVSPTGPTYTPRSKPLPPLEFDITENDTMAESSIPHELPPIAPAPIPLSSSSTTLLTHSKTEPGSTSARPLSPTTITKNRQEAEKKEMERIEKEKERTKERERVERLERERKEMEEKARLEKERMDRERWEKERLERIERERKESQRIERAERERIEREKELADRERVEREQAEIERRKEVERLERERELQLQRQQQLQQQQQAATFRARSPTKIVTEDNQPERPYHYRRASQTRLQQSPPASPLGTTPPVSVSRSPVASGSSSPTSSSPIRNIFSTRTPALGLSKPQRRATIEIPTGYHNVSGSQNNSGYTASNGSIPAGAFQLKRALSAGDGNSANRSGRGSPGISASLNGSTHWFQNKQLTTDPAQVHHEHDTSRRVVQVVDPATGIALTGLGPPTPPDSSEGVDEVQGQRADKGPVAPTSNAKVQVGVEDVNAQLKYHQQHQYSRYPNAWPPPPTNITRSQSQSLAGRPKAMVPMSHSASYSPLPLKSHHSQPNQNQQPNANASYPATIPILPSPIASPPTLSQNQNQSYVNGSGGSGAGMAGIGSGMGLRASTLGLPFAYSGSSSYGGRPGPYPHHHHRSQSHPIPHGFGYVIREGAEA